VSFGAHKPIVLPYATNIAINIRSNACTAFNANTVGNACVIYAIAFTHNRVDSESAINAITGTFDLANYTRCTFTLLLLRVFLARLHCRSRFTR
jgi:hypothetical protein